MEVNPRLFDKCTIAKGNAMMMNSVEKVEQVLFTSECRSVYTNETYLRLRTVTFTVLDIGNFATESLLSYANQFRFITRV